MLQRAHTAESLAAGTERTEAFRLTRALIGGARDAGYSAPQLAQCLGVTVATVVSRTARDEWISATVFADLAGIRNETIRRWRRQGRLPEPRLDNAAPVYRAGDLIRALIATGARKHTGAVAAAAAGG